MNHSETTIHTLDRFGALETSYLLSESAANELFAELTEEVDQPNHQLEAYQQWQDFGRLGRKRAIFTGSIALEGARDGEKIIYDYAFVSAHALSRRVAAIRHKEPSVRIDHSSYLQKPRKLFRYDDRELEMLLQSD